MIVIIGIIWGVFWAVISYRLAMSKGRKSFAPFAAILGFPLGLTGLGMVACVRSTPEAKKLRADAKVAKAGLAPRGEHEAIPAVPPELQVPVVVIPVGLCKPFRWFGRLAAGLIECGHLN